jgi:hypothetical protein
MKSRKEGSLGRTSKSEDRRWLHVPYSEKHFAKQVGAQWDPLVKMWWVPMHVPLIKVQKWVK